MLKRREMANDTLEKAEKKLRKQALKKMILGSAVVI